MKDLNSRRPPAAGRPMRLVVFAAGLVTAATAAAGLVVQANAAQPVTAKLNHGVLRIKGTNADDKLTLRLHTGDPGILELDIGDNGSADLSFEKASVANIVVQARAGDDIIRIDEGNGAFTDSTTTTMDGGDGTDE